LRLAEPAAPDGVAVAAGGASAGVAAAGVVAGDGGLAAGLAVGVATGVAVGVEAGVAAGLGASAGAAGGAGLHEIRATAAARVSTMKEALFISKEAFLRTGLKSKPVEICYFPIYSLGQQRDCIRSICSRGGTGRRVRLRSAWGDPWRFESSREHGSRFLDFSDMTIFP
jgi:hypothetical protein